MLFEQANNELRATKSSKQGQPKTLKHAMARFPTSSNLPWVYRAAQPFERLALSLFATEGW